MGKLIEIESGTRYGNLTVKQLSKNHRTPDNRQLWECLCDCGNITYARGSDLRNGKKKSCGCRIGIKNNVMDLTGKIFSYLTVIKQAPHRRTSGGRSIVCWECQCKCGNYITVDAGSLTSGNTKSCGCLNKENIVKNKKDLFNKRFGKLVVLDYNNGKGTWKCQCDCGNIINVSSYKLTSGNTKSCGCYKFEQLHGRHKDLTDKRVGKLILKYYIPGGNGVDSKWHCICDCGNEVDITTYSLTKPNPTVSCGCVKSKGELKISQILQQHSINFISQKTFEDCRFPDTNRLAFFDFYLPDYNCLIEYQGDQHYYASGFFSQKDVEQIKKRDQFKKEWCKLNNIKLIIIPYTFYDNLTIENLLPKGEV